MIDRCPFARKITYLSLRSAREHCFDGMAPYRCRDFPAHFHVGHPWKSRRQALRAMVHHAESLGLYDLPELSLHQESR